uniref:HPP transmembrane region domain-containing protein n=1 Tax=Lygus hesperus TaxID=30085 RepID=A0A0A9ZH78_LYGHE
MYLTTTQGAQPRALVCTHVLGAFLGVSFSHITHPLPAPLNQLLSSAFAVSIITVFMMITGTLQPSASATTCLAAFHLYGEMQDQGYMFIVAPALVGPLVIVFMG